MVPQGKKLILGLGYRARSGKDTVAEYLVRQHGFKRYAFADKLREICSILTGENAFAPDFKENSTPLMLSGGQLMQRVGMAMRQIDPSVWLHHVTRQIETSGHDKFVIPDVRFSNEAELLKRMGGVLVNIRRPGVARDTHRSETAGELITWDYVIDNSYSLDVLYRNADTILSRHGVLVPDRPAAAPSIPAPTQHL